MKSKLKKIHPGVVLGPDGRILEWTKPVEEPEKGHRHMSQLYALHPGISITQKTSAHFEAAKKLLIIDYSMGVQELVGVVLG